jgi:hypothetical protein
MSQQASKEFMTTTDTTLSVDDIHTAIKNEMIQIMANAKRATNPLMTIHLKEGAKTLSRLYSKLTNDEGQKRLELDLITGIKKQQPIFSHSCKSLDGNTPFKFLSKQISKELAAQKRT